MSQPQERLPERSNEENQQEGRERRQDLKEAIGRALHEREEQKTIMDVEEEMQGGKKQGSATERQERHVPSMTDKRFTMKEPQRKGTEGSAR